MPAGRPSSRPSSQGTRSSSRQATLSFNHRVTKNAQKSAKDLVSSSAPQSSPLAKHVIKAEPDIDIKQEEVADDVVKEVEQVAPPREKTEAELRADKVTDRQITQYWRGIERERRTKRVHQEDLSLAEKVLRYWDVSSQYGPCVGIDRIKRWQRADRLGLSPPVEVLAVLMKEENKGTEGIERAHMDEILNSSPVNNSQASV
ncbi:DNA polymerase delta, subunit 4-domain-containing protein [Nemania sp. FL0916]|nr:DNA polymerase delta, subunit 4-domain-containing protein [Nemania sp. FL0916]